MLIYDLEIVSAIPPQNPDDRIPEIRYCEGWHDTANMGISILGTYSMRYGKYKYFQRAKLHNFWEYAANHRLLCGFNNINFDNAVIAAELAKIPVIKKALNQEEIKKKLDAKSYDILREVWTGLGHNPDKFDKRTHAGFNLNAMAKANLPGCTGKSGTGAMAPILWQQGKHSDVIEYCLRDVRLTRDLMKEITNHGYLLSPLTGGRIRMRGGLTL